VPTAQKASVVQKAADHSAVDSGAKVITGNAGWLSANLENAAARLSGAAPSSPHAKGGASGASSDRAAASSSAASGTDTEPAGNAESGRKWSVQISAAPSKDTADNLLQQLKTNGHEGYIVQAEVKGQTYYRVRVGHFAAQGEADSLRQLLARDEGFRDAFLARD
jgi:cell division septation protein DedD